MLGDRAQVDAVNDTPQKGEEANDSLYIVIGIRTYAPRKAGSAEMSGDAATLRPAMRSLPYWPGTEPDQAAEPAGRRSGARRISHAALVDLAGGVNRYSSRSGWHRQLF